MKRWAIPWQFLFAGAALLSGEKVQLFPLELSGEGSNLELQVQVLLLGFAVVGCQPTVTRIRFPKFSPHTLLQLPFLMEVQSGGKISSLVLDNHIPIRSMF